MIYTELALYDRNYNENDIRHGLFLAIKHNFTNVSLPAICFSSIKDFVASTISISVPIDYPNGFLDSSLREYSIISAAKKGIKIVDLVINNYYLNTRKLDKLYEDIMHQQMVCKQYDILLRIILEYKSLYPSLYIKICQELETLGIEYIIPSVDTVDNYEDNLLASIDITNKTKINAITNGSIWQMIQYKAIVDSGVFGIRFNNIRSVEQIFGV